MAKNDGGPAYPAKIIKENHRAEKRVYHQPGMSLRDWFAGQFLNGITANDAFMQTLRAEQSSAGRAAAVLASGAYLYADAMLAERNK